MGTPIESTPGSNRDNGIKLSTSSVIWQGPDIPCIDLCKGDAVDDVIFKLATILCDVTENVLDVSTLEFACLVEEGAANPSTLLQTLQLIINKTCGAELTPVTESFSKRDETSTGDPLVYLPECLYFDRDGDTITALPVTEYAAYLATIICSILNDISSLSYRVDNLTTRLIDLESFRDSLTNYTYELYVTSQCASAPTPGQNMLIQDAFTSLESSFCDLMGATGVSTALIGAINKQCPGLNGLLQLSDPNLVMKDITGWVETPSTVSDSMTNMWLTICDMRYKLVNYFSIPVVPPCVLAVPENVTITTIATTYSTLEWTAPNYATIEPPIEYRIEVFQWTGFLPTGPSVYDIRTPSNVLTTNIPSISLTLGQDYVVYVHAVYSCGESNGAPVVSELIVPTILFKVKVTEVAEADTSVDCVESGLPVPYVVNNTKTTVTLVNAITDIPVLNTSGIPINVKIRYVVSSCAFFGPVYDDVTIAIPDGANYADYSYNNTTYTNCNAALCTSVTKAISCGISTDRFDAEFDTLTIDVC